ncbi:MAG: CoA pyrophosphatase [Polyangiaceae bacterium]|nr:CoA pyrophosphatase [Polyangiaceae bacterium]
MLPSYDIAEITARLARLGAALDSGWTGFGAEGAGGDPEPRAPAKRQAAVAAILRPPREAAGDAEILFVRRAEREGDPWSGHMAFPGGRREPGDASLLATAIRETREEVGLDLAAHGDLVARLPDVPAIARGVHIGMMIAPFVFTLRGAPGLALNAEIAEALWAPVGPLARGEGAGTMPYSHEGQSLVLPCLNVRGRVVWGLTYRMLQTLFDALHEG